MEQQHTFDMLTAAQGYVAGGLSVKFPALQSQRIPMRSNPVAPDTQRCLEQRGVSGKNSAVAVRAPAELGNNPGRR